MRPDHAEDEKLRTPAEALDYYQASQRAAKVPSDVTPCSTLLDLAIEWEAQAEIHESEGDADCGTGSDVPYAMASMLRDHARAIEAIAYANSLPNAKDLARRAAARTN